MFGECPATDYANGSSWIHFWNLNKINRCLDSVLVSFENIYYVDVFCFAEISDVIKK